MNKFFQRSYQLLLSFICGIFSITAVHAYELNIAAANSTCEAIRAVGYLFEQQNDVTIKYVCKSSGRLAKGLNGSTIRSDVFISANRKWMDYMVENNLVQQSNVVSPWGNKLVVAVRKGSNLNISEWQQLASDEVQSILIGDPGTAPFGRYSKQAMLSTGIWNQVKHKITTKKHITLLAETLTDSDNDTVGILFESNINSTHRKLFSVNKAWHPPIRYFVAPIENSENYDKVKAFLDFIGSNEAIGIFKAKKFQVDLN